MHGYPGTAKTTSALITRWFYDTPFNYDVGVETLSALGKALQEETLPTIIDDGYKVYQIEKVQGAFKKSMFSNNFRTVSDTNDLSKNNSYLALSTPIFTFNEQVDLKDGLIRRFIPLHYDESQIINDEIDKDFIIKFNPKSENSPLAIFNYIGRSYADKIIPLIETKDKKLLDLDTLTIELLKEIANEVNVTLNENLIKSLERDDSLDENIEDKLKTGLHKSLSKNIPIGYYKDNYIIEDFIRAVNLNKFDWLYYQKNNDEFIVNKNKYTKHCSKLANFSLSFNDINKWLNLGINTNNGNDSQPIKVNGKSIRGFRVPAEDVGKLFDTLVEKDE